MFGCRKGFGSVAWLAVALVGAHGCVSYESTQDKRGQGPDRAFAAWKAGDAITSALTRVISEHPPSSASGRYVVNFPKGTSTERARTAMGDLPSGATLPGEPGAEGLPVYHVSRVWIRNVQAKIDIAYPSTDALSGRRVDGGVTVWLRGSPLPWRVERLQYWHPGVVPVPELYVPISEEELEARRRAYEDAQMRGELESESELIEDEEPVSRDADTESNDDTGAVYREVTGSGGG